MADRTIDPRFKAARDAMLDALTPFEMDSTEFLVLMCYVTGQASAFTSVKSGSETSLDELIESIMAEPRKAMHKTSKAHAQDTGHINTRMI